MSDSGRTIRPYCDLCHLHHDDAPADVRACRDRLAGLLTVALAKLSTSPSGPPAAEREPSWVTITHNGWSPNGPTKRWTVARVDDASRLGEIGWYMPMKCYAFYGYVGVVYPPHALKEIAVFCEQATKESHQ